MNRFLILCAFVVSSVIADPPTASITAGGPEATDARVVKNHEYVFSTWAEKRLERSSVLDSAFCMPCMCPDWTCVLPPGQCDDAKFAEWPGKPQFRSFTVPLPASPGVPMTATDSPRATPRVVIVRIAEGVNGGDEANLPLVEPAGQDKQDTIAKRLKQKLQPQNDHKDITYTFYTLPLSGYHPAAIPLIVSTSKDGPVTVLAYANTTFFGSFIASSLVEDIGKTSLIVPGHKEAPFLPERDLTYLFGRKTKAIGQLSVDVIAGTSDRMIQDASFTVFDSPESSGDKGVWKPDLIIGMNFLNEIQGIKLTEEYSGSERAGAKKGMPVLVQKVVEAPGNRQPRRPKCTTVSDRRVGRDEL